MIVARALPLCPSMENFGSAMAILSAMITPAVLILASSSLILATSNRLSRVLDRTRNLAERYEGLLQPRDTDGQQLAEKLSLTSELLGRAARRASLLQRAMTFLYLALSVFVTTSIVIGIDAALGEGFTPVLVMLGLLGVVFLFSASVLLIVESRIALSAVNREMEFVRGLRERPSAARPH